MHANSSGLWRSASWARPSIPRCGRTISTPCLEGCKSRLTCVGARPVPGSHSMTMPLVGQLGQGIGWFAPMTSLGSSIHQCGLSFTTRSRNFNNAALNQLDARRALSLAGPIAQGPGLTGWLGMPIDPDFVASAARWAITDGALPPGLSLDAGSVVLSGISLELRTFIVQVRATYKGEQDSQQLRIQVGV